MKLKFDPNIKLTGIGLVPWTRLGPEQWLPNYSIASLYGWDIGNNSQSLPAVYSLNDETEQLPKLNKLNTQALINTKEFQKMLDTKLPGHDLLTYKPVKIPQELSNRKFLMVDQDIAKRYENKVQFRDIFKDKVDFPSFSVYERSKLEKTEKAFKKLQAGREKFVIQDEQLSGAKGTFVVSNYSQYCSALDNLDRLSSHTKVVISDFVEDAKERTIQGCITKDGIFLGPLQRQIIASPLLSNTLVPDGDKFCGVQILESDQNTPLHTEATDLAKVIGQELKESGYQGIFGVDFLLDKTGKLLVIEANPRITGVTPLLTAMNRSGEGVPFYLLHILSLGGYDYQITDKTVENTGSAALLVLHSRSTEEVKIESSPPSGTYILNGDKLKQLSSEINFTSLEDDQFIIQDYMPPNMTIKAGGRLLTVQFKAQMLDETTDELYNSTNALIDRIYSEITVKTE